VLNFIKSGKDTNRVHYYTVLKNSQSVNTNRYYIDFGYHTDFSNISSQAQKWKDSMVTRSDLNFTIHFYHRREISQSELTKQTIETTAEKLFKFAWPIRSIEPKIDSGLLPILFQPREAIMESGRAGPYKSLKLKRGGQENESNYGCVFVAKTNLYNAAKNM